MRVWPIVKSLPVAVGLPLMIGAASVGPEDAASNVSKWAKALGLTHASPAWLADRTADNWLLIAALSLAVIYSILAYGFPFGLTFAGWNVQVENFWARRISLIEAARLAYEAAERAGWAEYAGLSARTPVEKLDHFKHVYLTRARQKQITLYGERPPSRQSLPIHPDELSIDLRPVPGESSDLRPLMAADPTRFQNVWLTKREARWVARDHIRALKNVNRQL
jgi:hypothetical protein